MKKLIVSCLGLLSLLVLHNNDAFGAARRLQALCAEQQPQATPAAGTGSIDPDTVRIRTIPPIAHIHATLTKMLTDKPEILRALYIHCAIPRYSFAPEAQEFLATLGFINAQGGSAKLMRDIVLDMVEQDDDFFDANDLFFQLCIADFLHRLKTAGHKYTGLTAEHFLTLRTSYLLIDSPDKITATERSSIEDAINAVQSNHSSTLSIKALTSCRRPEATTAPTDDDSF